MVATGFLFFVAPLAAQVDSSIVQTLGLLWTDYWTITFVLLLLVFPQRRGLHGRVELLLLVAFAIPLVVAQPLWLLFVEEPGLVNDLGFWPNERAADWIDKGQRGVAARRDGLALPPAFAAVVASEPTAAPGAPARARRGCHDALRWGAPCDRPDQRDQVTGAPDGDLIVLATVPAAFVVGLLRSRFARRGRRSRRPAQSDSAPTLLPASIARALHDPSATLAYWLPE